MVTDQIKSLKTPELINPLSPDNDIIQIDFKVPVRQVDKAKHILQMSKGETLSQLLINTEAWEVCSQQGAVEHLTDVLREQR